MDEDDEETGDGDGGGDEWQMRYVVLQVHDFTDILSPLSKQLSDADPGSAG